MRYFLALFGLAVLTTMLIFGKQGDMSRKPPLEVFPDMDRQPKLRPQTANSFFADRLSSQLPVAGTVARDSAYEDNPVNTGRISGTTNFIENIPVPVTVQLLERGQQRYQIYCSPCHSALGDGNGVTKKLGMTVVATLHDPRIVKLPDGEIYNTIANGKNLMGAYGAALDVNDRWAVVAYVRTLQRAQLANVDDLPENKKAAFKK
ncbi:MAG: cytochrome c [Verrucomicrobiota bacterium]